MKNNTDKTTGIYVRSNFGTFTHWFIEPLTLKDARTFFDNATRGHDVKNGKIYAQDKNSFYTPNAY
tara:strand:+ start:154 stop:351 length:198 start_codon:yes stop_codon:yes gene_type:complete